MLVALVSRVPKVMPFSCEKKHPGSPCIALLIRSFVTLSPIRSLIQSICRAVLGMRSLKSIFSIPLTPFTQPFTPLSLLFIHFVNDVKGINSCFQILVKNNRLLHLLFCFLRIRTRTWTTKSHSYP